MKHTSRPLRKLGLGSVISAMKSLVLNNIYVYIYNISIKLLEDLLSFHPDIF